MISLGRVILNSRERDERRRMKEDLIRRYREDGLERLESDVEKKREFEKKNRNPVGS